MTVLVRDDAGQPLAVTCKDCGRFCLDTVNARCARCWMGSTLTAFVTPRAEETQKVLK